MHQLPTLIQWMKRQRAALDLTQEQLADQIGCAVQTVRMLETGRRRPSRALAERMAEVMDVPAAERERFLLLARTPQPVGNQAAESPVENLSTREAPRRRAPLPVVPNALLGRGRDRERIVDALTTDGCRLVSLVGLGGIGKTRLAIAVASDLDDQWAHGVAWVSLAPLTTGDQLASTVAAGLGLVPPTTGDALGHLLDALADRKMLIVLDNAEHLPAIGELVGDILASAPEVRLLVTSRERLKVPGEWAIELQGLAVASRASEDEGDIAPAVQLFVERARQSDHTFVLGKDNRRVATQICQLLEGVPLAIELAAAWVRTLTPQEIAIEIARDLDVLGGTGGGQVQRHRSLRDMFESSWQMLSAEKQRTLARLSVFRGGFERAACAQVAEGTLPLLSALIDTSLVRRAENTGGSTRYDLHTLIRQYAAEKLAVDSAADDIHRRHATYYASLLDDALPHLQGGEAAQTIAVLLPELGNFRSAQSWCLRYGDWPLLRRLTVGIAFVSELRGWLLEEVEPLAQSVEALRAALQASTSSDLKVMLGQVLTWYGRARGRRGATVEACQLLEEAAALLTDHEQVLAATGTLGYLGLLLTYRGRFAEAEAVIERNLALLRPRGASFFITLTCVFGAFVKHAQGDEDQTDALLTEARAYAEASGSARGRTLALCKSAWVANDRGAVGEAEALAREGLRVGAVHRDRWGLGWALFQLGRVSLARDDSGEAVYLLKESIELFEETGDPWSLSRVEIALGRVERARGDQAVAKRRLLDVLSAVHARHYETLALDAIFGLAEVAVDVGSVGEARQLLKVVREHPAAEHVRRLDASALLAQIASAPHPGPAHIALSSLDVLVRQLLQGTATS